MRALVAACSACLSALCVHPLDTMHLRRQIHAGPLVLTNPMAGCVPSGVGAFVKTGVYFGFYEYGLRSLEEGPLRIPMAVLLGCSASTVPGIYLTVTKKRRQAAANGMLLGPLEALSTPQWLRLYALSTVIRYPRTVVRYLAYEALLLHLSPRVRLVGVVAGFLSSILVNVIFEPLEALRSHQCLGRRPSSTRLYDGVVLGIVTSTLANTIGHGILEAVYPR